MAAHDVNGKAVTAGSRVRILSLASRWLDDLPPSERTDVLSMVGGVFAVAEVDDYGQAWVEKVWLGNGGWRSHSVGLCSDEMELAPA